MVSPEHLYYVFFDISKSDLFNIMFHKSKISKSENLEIEKPRFTNKRPAGEQELNY